MRTAFTFLSLVLATLVAGCCGQREDTLTLPLFFVNADGGRVPATDADLSGVPCAQQCAALYRGCTLERVLDCQPAMTAAGVPAVQCTIREDTCTAPVGGFCH